MYPHRSVTPGRLTDVIVYSLTEDLGLAVEPSGIEDLSDERRLRFKLTFDTFFVRRTEDGRWEKTSPQRLGLAEHDRATL